MKWTKKITKTEITGDTVYYYENDVEHVTVASVKKENKWIVFGTAIQPAKKFSSKSKALAFAKEYMSLYKS